jgi:hypothetical protein
MIECWQRNPSDERVAEIPLSARKSQTTGAVSKMATFIDFNEEMSM